MRVKIESTGGFTGRNAVVALYDTDALSAGRAGGIRDAVDALAAAQARGGEGEIGADLPAYLITVDEAGEEPRVFEVRGDPAAGASSVLGALLQGPEPHGPDAT
ncbi:hypothetical protein HUT06_38480 [Actinomadura sp. NAK00032]|uniref:hypothetical protein n=1 Tax=Actinomadura sp. NAK00032 TaxID=2742128 RepID=UPI001591B798|nr:hypothetical protein [Actinomadura sp. NAK00032]QKW39193.1 hypothetical protein HUT06_38480 [Actinomadura sp. NAK00032]